MSPELRRARLAELGYVRREILSEVHVTAERLRAAMNALHEEIQYSKQLRSGV